MLRIAPEAPPPNSAPPPEINQPPQQTPPPPDPTQPDLTDLGDPTAKVDPQKAGYMDPVQGGFKCANCTFWTEPNGCQIVSGQIDSEGICQLFTQIEQGGEGADQGDVKSPPEQTPQEGGA